MTKRVDQPVKVAAFEMFKGLPNVELAKLLGRLDRVPLSDGETLFRQGDAGDSLYLIESGSVELLALGADGEPQSLAMLGAGDALGEMALLTGEARSATAVAASPCALYRIDAETLERLVAEQPTVSVYFIRLLSRRLTATNDRLHETKAARGQWIERELAPLPEPIVDCLLWCAVVPAVDEALALRSFRVNLREAFDAEGAPLRSLMRLDAAGRLTMEPDARAALADRAQRRVGYAQRRAWLEEAAEAYADAEAWAPAVAAYAELERWDEALSAWERIAGAAGKAGAATEAEDRAAEDRAAEDRDAAYRALAGCPLDRWTTQEAAFDGYMRYCAEQAPETGLKLVEALLEEDAPEGVAGGAAGSSPVRRAQGYAWGAELAHRLGRKTQALQYMQLAETAAAAEASPAGANEERAYGLIKQAMLRRRSEQLAKSQSRLLGGSRLAGPVSVAAAILSALLFHVMPPIAGLSEPAMDFLGIGVGAVILWIVGAIPDYIVALAMIAAWVLTGLAEPSVALSGYASPTWLYMVFIMALSAAVTKSGILYRLSLLGLKRVPATYRGQLWGLAAGGLLLNPLIPSSSAKVSLGVPIARTVAEAMGFADNGRGAAGLGLAAMLFYGFTAPFVMTGSYTNVMAYGLVSGADPIAWLEWLLYALPAMVVFTVALFAILSFSLRGVAAPRPVSQEVLEAQLRLLGPLTKDERVSLLVVFGCIAGMMLEPLHGVGSAWVMMAGFAALVVSGVLRREALLTGIDWTFLLFLGAAFGFSAVADQLGLVGALSTFLGEHLAGVVASPTWFLLAVIAVSFIVTLVVRDDPAVILLVTALVPLSAQAGVHPWVLVFVILLSTDPFFFAYQSPTYLTAYHSTEGKAFSHRQGQKAALWYAAALLVAVAVCVPYWRWIGLIS
ncbi:anion permease [Paenibacillus sp. TRM 82003]|nr:anion permease [Paenibacillus sp. TRM 82003]